MNNRRAFIVGIQSINLSKNEIRFLRTYKPQDYFVTRNIKDINQTSQLIKISENF